MAKILCKTLGLPSNSYRAPSGRDYMFHRGVTTEIADKKDAEYFLSCGGAKDGGKSFEQIGVTTKPKKAVKKIIDKVKEKVGIKKKTEVEKLYENGKTPDEKALKEAKKKDEENKRGAKKYTEKELYDLNRQPQVDLIKKLGGQNQNIPGREGDRVKLILKLQS